MGPNFRNLSKFNRIPHFRRHFQVMVPTSAMMGITGAFSTLGIAERSLTADKTASADETETGEQPVDFSKKYSETKEENDPKCSFKVVANYSTTFTIYAETDLDQPTDYSLRYAEDDSDSDQCGKSEAVEFVQDTIKTYCTEDTPYETPFTFSTSTSMSDLRIDDKSAKLDAKSAEITEEVTGRKVKSESSSGLMSPEKPVNYCEEGTPGYFSRVASCGSLNSLSANDPPKREAKDGKKESRRVGKFSTEAKAVKFEDVVDYAEETPLMFSRSSSLASLDSIEQHSIHDDRSSVVSDFSRLTSGVISPSELPDSPSQTVPPSPKPRKGPIVGKKPDDEPTEAVGASKSGVFEDAVRKFKTESTPLEFSTATSLSSLIGDEAVPRGRADRESSENSDDEDILAACINIGMRNNRYSHSIGNCPPDITSARIAATEEEKQKSDAVRKSDVSSDCVRLYCTEDTPALLSHAGSNSNLSALSMRGNEESDEIERVTGTSDAYNSEIVTVRNNQEEAPPEDAKPNDVLNISLEIREDGHDSRRSSFSSLSDDSHESERALLQKCILAGMPKPVYSSEIIADELSDDDDEEDADVLADCINIGMNSNKYSHRKKTTNNDITDTVKNYCTEDTPALLSNAGSCSNLSILSAQEENSADYFSDLDGNFSDEDDERLLEECVKYGMAAISEKISVAKTVDRTEDEKEQPDTSSSLSDEEDLLERCIRAGMPRKTNDCNDLTPSEKALLQRCILEGMKTCRASSKKDASELTEAEQALLRRCILSGMPKNKNLTQGGPSGSRETADLTESERSLLQQCIVAGMPKSRKSWRRSKETKNEGHTCCVHCPRNGSGGQNGHVRTRRRIRERGVVQVREGRDVNILYVTSQILTLKKEIVDGSNEKWV